MPFNSFTLWMIQGELFIIDDTNNIYYLPCGDLCGDSSAGSNENSVGSDDSYVGSDYSYLGCYVDGEDRVLSWDSLTQYADMTTQVRVVCLSVG